MKLSILIPTIRVRQHKLQLLYDELLAQTLPFPGAVEILALLDNRAMTVGDKRNVLLRASRGAYVAFVDDDDWVGPDYVRDIVAAIGDFEGVDVLVPRHEVRGFQPEAWYLSLLNEYKHARGVMYGKPRHTCVWRGELARCCEFSQQNYGEDTEWAARVCELAQTELLLDHAVYYYYRNPGDSAVRKDRIEALKKEGQA